MTRKNETGKKTQTKKGSLIKGTPKNIAKAAKHIKEQLAKSATGKRIQPTTLPKEEWIGEYPKKAEQPPPKVKRKFKNVAENAPTTVQPKDELLDLPPGGEYLPAMTLRENPIGQAEDFNYPPVPELPTVLPANYRTGPVKAFHPLKKRLPKGTEIRLVMGDGQWFGWLMTPDYLEGESTGLKISGSNPALSRMMKALLDSYNQVNGTTVDEADRVG